MRLSVRHNFAADLGARILSTAASFGLSVTMVRYLGPTLYGRYSFAMSLGAILIMVVNLGLNDLIVRDVAKDPSTARSYMAKMFIFRTALSIPIFLLTPAIAHLMGKESEIVAASALAAGYLILFHGCTLFWSIWTGLHRLWMASISQMLDRVAALAVVLIVARYSLGLNGILWGFIFVGAALFTTTAAVSFGRIRPSGHPDRDRAPSFFRALAGQGWPLIVLSVIGVLVVHGERVILSGVRGDEELGYYSAAATLLQFPLFLPLALVSAFYPRFSQLVAHEPQQAGHLYRKVMGYVLLFGIATGVGGVLLSEDILTFVYGKAYASSSRVFAILCIGLPLAVPGKLLSLVALSRGKQAVELWIYAATTPPCLALQYWAAARYGFEGVALVRVGFELLRIALFYALIARPFNPTLFVAPIVKSVAAAAGMSLVVRLVPEAHLLTRILLGAAVYVGLLLGLRVLDEEDRRLLISTFRR